MAKPNESNPNLLAYADGELSGDEAIRAVERISQDPDAAQTVLHQQRLRQAVGRVMDDSTLRAPEDLRARIAELAATLPADRNGSDGPPAVAGRIGRWAPLAVAALVVIGIPLVMLVISNLGGATPSGPYTRGPGLSPIDVAHFTERHTVCSVSLDALMDDPTLPQSVEELPGALQERFGAAPAGLDLSSLGFTFAAVGPCTAPGSPSVHLVYRPLPDSGHTEPISLWIRPANPDLDLPPGEVLQVTADGAERPLLVWRAGGLDYWVVTGGRETGERVADRLMHRL